MKYCPQDLEQKGRAPNKGNCRDLIYKDAVFINMSLLHCYSQISITTISKHNRCQEGCRLNLYFTLGLFANRIDWEFIQESEILKHTFFANTYTNLSTLNTSFITKSMLFFCWNTAHDITYNHRLSTRKEGNSWERVRGRRLRVRDGWGQGQRRVGGRGAGGGARGRGHRGQGVEGEQVEGNRCHRWDISHFGGLTYILYISQLQYWLYIMINCITVLCYMDRYLHPICHTICFSLTASESQSYMLQQTRMFIYCVCEWGWLQSSQKRTPWK